MTTVKVSLAEPAARWVDDQVATGRYRDADAYLADLVERDREEAAKLAYVRQAVAEGLASGISKRSLAEIIAEGRARHANG